MAKNRRSKRAPARAGVKRAKAANRRKRVVALKQPEAVILAPETAPRRDASAGRMPLFLWPFEVLRWWMPRDAARKGA
jgi:hypothetical protein